LSSLSVANYNYNSSNELTSNSTGSYTYDKDGEMLTRPDGTQFSWDYENRLSQAVLPSGGGTVTFYYDPFGRRIQKSGPLGITNYFYDGPNILETADQNGNVLASYADTQSIDEPLAESASGSVAYYEQDGLGTVTSLTDVNGNPLDTYTYDSYGNLTDSTGNFPNPFQFTGREFDQETEDYYYRARYYDPTIGRFSSEDPIHFKGGPDFYEYARNNPIRYIDRLGLWGGDLPDACSWCHIRCDLRFEMQAMYNSVAFLVRGELAGMGTVDPEFPSLAIGQDDPASIAHDAAEASKRCVGSRQRCHFDCNASAFCNAIRPAFPF
jgi:RHS repeat-associated protein